MSDIVAENPPPVVPQTTPPASTSPPHTAAPTVPYAAPVMTSAIVTERLTKRYGPLTALDHLDLVLERGDVFGFIGPNGAGKSTTMKILAGLLRPTSGMAYVLGKDVMH